MSVVDEKISDLASLLVQRSHELVEKRIVEACPVGRDPRSCVELVYRPGDMALRSEIVDGKYLLAASLPDVLVRTK